MTDITDITKQLRTIREHLHTGALGQREVWEEWLAEAADELDQLFWSKKALQAEIERLRLICDDTVKHLEEAEAENERLGSEAKRWKDAEERADRCIIDLRKIIDGTERREAEYLALVEKHATEAERLQKLLDSALIWDEKDGRRQATEIKELQLAFIKATIENAQLKRACDARDNLIKDIRAEIK